MIAHYRNSIYVSLDRNKAEIDTAAEMSAWEKAQAYADEHDMQGDVKFVETEQTSANTSRIIFHVE